MIEILRQAAENPDPLLAGRSGKDFERNVCELFEKNGFRVITEEEMTEIARQGNWQSIKAIILSKESGEIPKNATGLEKAIAQQPHGSQEYPDAIVFDQGSVIPLEMKCVNNNQGHPMWNSGLPRPNGIYLFGSRNRKKVMFFHGGSLIDQATATKFRDFFEQVKDLERKFNAEHAAANEFGLQVYVRRAYSHSQVFNKNAKIDLFAEQERLQAEAEEFLRRAQERNNPPKQQKGGPGTTPSEKPWRAASPEG